jgi:hypothetical protein
MIKRTAELEASLGTEADFLGPLTEDSASIPGISTAPTRQEVEDDFMREFTVGKMEFCKFLVLETKVLKGIVRPIPCPYKTCPY